MAHMAVFRRHFVESKHVLSDRDYAELMALCQIIPGPASSQVGMALGYRLGGLAGALAAWFGFTLPSAVLMGVGGWLWLSGSLMSTDWVVTALKLVALGVVTQAVIGMWQSLCLERVQRIGALITAILFYLVPTAWMQLALIAAGLAIASVVPPQGDRQAAEMPQQGPSMRLWGQVIGLMGLVAIGVVLASLETFDGLAGLVSGHFYSGALVFGGGHVVLPLLEAEFVPPLDADGFLAGYGLVQAMPGPLFTLSSYLGVLSMPGDPLVGSVLAVVAIFLPGACLLAAASLVGQVYLPWLKPRLWLVNATVVGLLLSVLVNPIFTESVTSTSTTVLAIIALVMTVGFKRSPLELVGVILIGSFLMHHIG